MSKLLAGLPGGSGLWGAIAFCAVLFGAGYYVQQGRDTAQVVEQVAAILPQVDTTTTAIAPISEEIAAVQQAIAPTAPNVMTSAPAFDEVRREADGMTVIAGRGLPGAVVSVMKDGVEIATSTVDRSGKFATLAVIPPDGLGHSLTLSQQTATGIQASAGEVLLAPISLPVDVTTAPTGPTEVAVPTAEAQSAGIATTHSTAIAVATAPAQLPPADADTAPSIPQTSRANATLVQDTSDLAEPAVQAPAEESPVIAALEDAAPQPTAPAAVLRATADGVELLNTAAPEVMDNVALDTISYSESGDVQLAGRAQSEAVSVQVYLDNNAVAVLPVDKEGRWRGDVPDVDQGIYTLRVDELAENGKISSRVETPFKREDPAVLAAATAAAADGPIKAITVQKGATLWAIARDRYGSGDLYVRVFEANKEAIRDPDLIYPGQIFELPQQ